MAALPAAASTAAPTDSIDWDSTVFTLVAAALAYLGSYATEGYEPHAL